MFLRISQKLTVLNQATLESLEKGNKTEIIEKFTIAGMRILEANFGFVWFKHDGEKKFSLAYKSQNLPFEPVYPRQRGYNYQAYSRKKPFFRVHTRKTRLSRYDVTSSVKSYVIIPIAYKKVRYGNIILCFKHRHEFRDEERGLCMALGHSAAQTLMINELLSNLKNFRDTLDATVDAIFIFDARSYRFEYVNQGATRLLGYSKKEILGRRIIDIQPQFREDDFLALTRALREKRKDYLDFEAEVINKSGEKIPVGIFLQLVQTSGQPEKFLGVVHDISARKRVEEAQRRLLKQKDEFLGVASHELRTPVTTIKGFAQLLQKRLQGRDKSTDLFLRKINSQVDKLSQLVDELLDVSRIDSGKMGLEKKEFDLSGLLKDAVENLQLTSEHHKIQFYRSAPAPIIGDWNRLTQVFLNIITNAIKYAPETEEILVKIGFKGVDAVVSVQDFGPGIPPEYQKQIFEKFFQGKSNPGTVFPGLGLGLHISKEIVKRHNGDIWFESTEGQGTTFYVKLPLASSRLL